MRARKKGISRIPRSARKELPEAPKIPWNGELDTKQLVRPAGPLLAMLYGRRRQLGHTRAEMTKYLGVTYGYLGHLSVGLRRPESISGEFAGAVARYLGIPRVAVLLACGALTPQDFFADPNELVQALPKAIEFIKEDGVFGPLVPPEVLSEDASARLQFFIVRLFEKARGVKLLPGEHSPDQLIKWVEEIEQQRKKAQGKSRPV